MPAIRLLLFSDLHSDQDTAADLVRRARAVDAVVCAGDLCNAHQRLGRIVDVLKAIDRPTVLVAGNNETTSELREACADVSHFDVLHGEGVDLLGVPFWGVGGGIPTTPFGAWSYDFAEDQAEPLLAGCPDGAVLVTHSPPFGMLDVGSSGKNLGSTAIRAVIERRRPRLVVCGHIHASGGKTATLGTTTVINAGPGGIVWEG
jgi:Icc-related predicted phosphoesterase